MKRAIRYTSIGSRHRRSDSMDSIASFSDNRNTSKEFFFTNPGNKVINNRDDFCGRQEENSEKDYSAIRRRRITQDVPEISIAGNKYQRFSFYRLIDFFIRGSWLNITYIKGLMSGFLEGFSNRAWTVCVNEKFHRLHYWLAKQFLFVGKKGGIKYTGLDIFRGDGAEFFFDLVKAHSRSQRFEDDMNRNARPLDAWLAMLDIRIYADMFFKKFFIRHFIFSFAPKVYHSHRTLSTLGNDGDSKQVGEP